MSAFWSKLVFETVKIGDGSLRVVVAPRLIGYRWFLTDHSYVSDPGGSTRLAYGWTLTRRGAYYEAACHVASRSQPRG